jgi:hypothetical protein
MGEITSVHDTRHVHVGVEKSDIRMRFQVLECALGMLGLKYLEAHRGQHVGGDETGEFIIVGKHG